MIYSVQEFNFQLFNFSWTSTYFSQSKRSVKRAPFASNFLITDVCVLSINVLRDLTILKISRTKTSNTVLHVQVSIKLCHNMQQTSAIWMKLFITEQPPVTQVLCPEEQSREEPRSTETLIVPEQITNQSMKLIRWTAVGQKKAQGTYFRNTWLVKTQSGCCKLNHQITARTCHLDETLKFPTNTQGKEKVHEDFNENLWFPTTSLSRHWWESDSNKHYVVKKVQIFFPIETSPGCCNSSSS